VGWPQVADKMVRVADDRLRSPWTSTKSDVSWAMWMPTNSSPSGTLRRASLWAHSPEF